jgi:hypothetical protein
MAKFDKETMKDIVLQIGNSEEPIVISGTKALSWAKLVATQSFLDMTIETMQKWYQSMGSLENILDGRVKFWQALKDAVCEAFLQDYIDNGVLGFTKQKVWDCMGEMFDEAFELLFQDIKNVYQGVEVDRITHEAYREVRKDSRSRVMGIGFGITGGIKAAAGATLGNAATGLGHSLFNAIGNSIGKASANKQMDEFYRQDSTLQTLLDGWDMIFWKLYDRHIEDINALFIITPENKTDRLLNYSQLMDLKEKAATIYENIQKVENPSDEQYLVAIYNCTELFPFEATYWKIFLHLTIFASRGDESIFNSVIVFGSQMNKYVQGFGVVIVSDAIDALIDTYQDMGDDEKDAKSYILNLLGRLFGDTDYQDYIIAVFTNRFENKDATNDDIAALVDLLHTLGKSPKDYISNKSFQEAYELKMYALAMNYCSADPTNRFLDVMQKGADAPIVADILKAHYIDPNQLILFMMHTALYSIQTQRAITQGMVDNIGKLGKAIGADTELSSISDYKAIKVLLMPIDDKYRIFMAFLSNIANANPEYVFGKHSYWGSSLKTIPKKMADAFYVDSSKEAIIFASDRTMMNSGKAGIIVTTQCVKYLDMPDGYLANWEWNEFLEHGMMEVTATTVSFAKAQVEGKASHLSRIDTYDLDGKLFASIIKMGCLLFVGKSPEIDYLDPLPGTEFDVWKLCEQLSIADKPTQKINPGVNDTTNTESVNYSSLSLDEKVKQAREAFHIAFDNDNLGKSYFTDETISDKMRGNMRKNLDVDDDEQLIAFFDTTIFHSGKEGFAVTSAGLRCKGSNQFNKNLPNTCLWSVAWEELPSYTGIIRPAAIPVDKNDKVILLLKENQEESDCKACISLSTFVNEKLDFFVKAMQQSCLLFTDKSFETEERA